MGATFTLQILTRTLRPEPRDVVSINVPASRGRLTVMAHHQPQICLVTEGEVVITDAEGKQEAWRVGRGALNVEREKVTLLAESIEAAGRARDVKEK